MPTWLTIFTAIMTLLPQVSAALAALIQEIEAGGQPPTQDQMDKLAAYSSGLGGLQAIIDYHANS